MSDEKVLAIPARAAFQFGVRPGFDTNSALAKLIVRSTDMMEFRLRDEVEDDASWLQLIPYCIPIDDAGMIFGYYRGKSGGEDRLYDKISIGIGGHINPCDAIGGRCDYVAGAVREIEEEVWIDPSYSLGDPVAIIYDDSDSVGRVHLGIVHIVDIEGSTVSPREDSIGDPLVLNAKSFAAVREQMEGWSQLCIDYLAQPATA